MAYAEKTSVSVKKSRDEIEQLLTKYGADQFFYGSSIKGKGIGFAYKGRAIKIGIPMPDKGTYGFSQAGQKKWEQEERRRWRVLLIALKAKLELIDVGLTTFEDEFLAQTCLPDGGVVGDWAKNQIDTMITAGKMPQLLPSGMD
jgi:hypothetical protein